MKKILGIIASVGLIATTAPTVVACGQKEKALPGQYETLERANYDQKENLAFNENQIKNLMFYQVANYLKEHPDFRNTDFEDTENKIDNKLEWTKDLDIDDADYSASFKFEFVDKHTVKVFALTLPKPTEIGKIWTKGNLATVEIYKLEPMKIMVDQEEFDKISKPYNNDDMLRLFREILKNPIS